MGAILYKARNLLMGKKADTLLLLFDQCSKSGIYEFDNKQVKSACKATGFGNPFDVTKIDHTTKLPDKIRQAGYCIVHLGEGRHCFVKGIESWYHRFEEISDGERKVWEYRPSILNATDDSESNIISLVYNQRIIHHFLYSDITANPRIYMSRRTKISPRYSVGKTYQLHATKLQMEMDATLENCGVVTIIEGKNNFPDDFAVYQLFHPYLDYRRKELPSVQRIQCCYLAKKMSENGDQVVRLHLYTFDDEKDIASISLIKKAEYTLERRES